MGRSRAVTTAATGSRRAPRAQSSTVSSNRRLARVSRCSTASWACGPEARTSTSCPRRAARVATRLRLPAGTGPAPVVRLRSCDGRVERAHLADQSGGRPRVQPVGVLDGEDADDSSARPRTGAGASPSVGDDRWADLPISASRASAATSARLAPPAAATAATMRPSTMGAGESVTRSRIEGSRSRSSASSALSTALPRSMSTTTPAGPSARSIASLMLTASVPNVVSSRPAATSISDGAAVQHLRRQGDRGAGEAAAVRDDDQPDAVPGVEVGVVCRSALCTVHSLRSLSRLTPIGRAAQNGLGGRFEQQGDGRRARILMAHAALAEVAGPALARQHRRRRVPTRRGGVAGELQRGGQRLVLAEGGVQRVDGRRQRVVHRLVAGPGLAAVDDAAEPGPQRGREVGRRDGLGVAERAAHPQEEGPEQRARWRLRRWRPGSSPPW